MKDSMIFRKTSNTRIKDAQTSTHPLFDLNDLLIQIAKTTNNNQSTTIKLSDDNIQELVFEDRDMQSDWALTFQTIPLAID